MEYLQVYVVQFLSDAWGVLVPVGTVVSVIEPLGKIVLYIARALGPKPPPLPPPPEPPPSEGPISRAAPLLGLALVAGGLTFSPVSPFHFLHPSGQIAELPTHEVGSDTNQVKIEKIGGKVSGVWDPATKKIVIYARQDHWYVQPFDKQPLTDISPTGAWRGETHAGTEFAALVVRANYAPPPVVDALPPTGGDVLAVIREIK